jgi:aspartokinase
MLKISSILLNENLTLYRLASLSDKPGSVGYILDLLGNENINIEYITETGTLNDFAALTFCVKIEDTEKVDVVFEEKNLNRELRILKTENTCSIGIYGPHFREKPRIGSDFFKLLGNKGINILGISTAFSSISCIIEEDRLESALQAIKQNYKLP